MKVAAYTFGCKVNQYDTNAMLELLEKNGCRQVPFREEADLYLINTCTVTNTADKKSMNMIRRVHKLHPNAKICVCGCLAQKQSEELLAMDGVYAVIGTENRASIVSVVNQAVRQQPKSVSAASGGRDFQFEEMSVHTSGELTRGYIKIQEGCDRFCSYCIIPFVRGRSRSRRMSDALREARRMAQNGVKEIVLTGVHISSYGADNGESLIALLRGLNDTDGIERIRLGSLEPGVLREDFVSGVFTLKKICPHFHISLQSGCDKILERMNRRYRTREFTEYVGLLRAYYDRPAITTDIIAGFPGETERDFLETAEYLREIGFSRVHVFPYSERENTKAASMDGAVDKSIRKERTLALISAAEDAANAFAQSFIGERQRVLFESESDGCAEGYTTRYQKVRAEGKPGELKDVLIKGYRDGVLFG